MAVSSISFPLHSPFLSSSTKKISIGRQQIQVLEHEQRKVAKVVLHPDFRQREVAWQSQWDGVG